MKVLVLTLCSLLCVQQAICSTGCLLETTCSRIEALIDLDVSCCDLSKSAMDVLISVQETCCNEIQNKIDAIAGLEQTCCSSIETSLSQIASLLDTIDPALCSNVDIISSQVDDLVLLEESCCQQTLSSLDIIGSLFDGTVGSLLDALVVNQGSCCSQSISLLEQISVSIVASSGSCTQVLTQADITPGASITNPGYYCLASDVSYGGGSYAITVLSDDVVLDLSGHTIALNTTSDSAISIGTYNNVMVKNGSIVNGKKHISSTASNVRCESLYLYNYSEEAINLDSAGQRIVLSNLFIDTTNNTGTTGLLSKSSYLSATNLYINRGETGILVSDTSNIVISNSVVMQAVGSGIEVGAANNIVLENSVFSKCGLKGAYIYDSGTNTYDISITNCTFESNTEEGLLLENSGGARFYAVLIRECFFSSNLYGCVLNQPSGSGAMYDIVLLNGISESNLKHGFGSSDAGSNILFKGCTSGGNGGDGIVLGGNTVLSQVLQCDTSNNANIGINDVSSSNFIYGNASCNNGTNYSGSVPLTGTPTLTTSYWANVRP